MKRNQLLEEMKTIMLFEIPHAVKAIKLEETDEVCYISLYGSDSEPVLGLITLGIKSYRDEMLKEEVEDKLWYIWNSGEMPACYQMGLEQNNRTFKDKQEEFVSLYEDEEWDELWKLSQDARFDVALQLNQLNWKGILPVTDDFVVYSDWEAIDVTDGDLEKSIPKKNYSY